MTCPPPATSAPPDVLANEAKALTFYTSNLRACADHFRSQGIDLAAYTTNAIADDVDDLRQALGVEKINLLGHSYGTHHDIHVANEAQAVVVDFFKGQDVSGRKVSLPPPRFRAPEGASVK